MLRSFPRSESVFSKFFFLDMEARFCTHFDADNMLNIRERRNFGIWKSKVKFDDFTCNNK